MKKGSKCSLETIAKMKKAANDPEVKKKRYTKERNENVSKSRKRRKEILGYINSPETREKMGLARRGKTYAEIYGSEEEALNQIKKINTPERNKKISENNGMRKYKGKKLAEIVGDERARVLKEASSSRRKGKTMFDLVKDKSKIPEIKQKMSDHNGSKKRFGKTNAQYFGEERANQISDAISIGNKGMTRSIETREKYKLAFNNPEVQEKKRKTCLERYGVPNPGILFPSPIKYYSNYAGMITLQSSYELRTAKILDILCEKGLFAYYDRYLKTIAKYIGEDRKEHSYHTDFKVVDWDGNYFYLDPKNDYAIKNTSHKINEVLKQGIPLKVLPLKEIELLEKYVKNYKLNENETIKVLNV